MLSLADRLLLLAFDLCLSGWEAEVIAIYEAVDVIREQEQGSHEGVTETSRRQGEFNSLLSRG